MTMNRYQQNWKKRDIAAGLSNHISSLGEKSLWYFFLNLRKYCFHLNHDTRITMSLAWGEQYIYFWKLCKIEFIVLFEPFLYF
jgi:hypothetical protein